MRNLFYFVISSVLFSFSGMTQGLNFAGVVHAAENKEPVPFVKVSLQSKKDTFLTQTNFNGEFEFNNLQESKYHLSVELSGYAKFDSTIRIKKNTPTISVSLKFDTSLIFTFDNLGYNKLNAKADIRSNTIKLVFPGGIAGTPRSPFDKDFEDKYNLTLVYPGCISFQFENRKEYNYEVFNYLDSVFGLEWREDIRNEIIGFEEYIESKKPGSLTITAIDLSEDMSRLSTKNDEIFVFIYDYSDTNKLAAPLVSSKLFFDKDNSIQSISVPNNSNKILFFIEEDSFRNIEQIEPIIRIYFKEIMKCKDYNQIKKYLGEDDLLGFKIIDSSTKKFTISGMSSLDTFNYLFVFK